MWEESLCPGVEPCGYEVMPANPPGLSLPFTWGKLARASNGSSLTLRSFHPKADPEATRSSGNFYRDNQGCKSELHP